MSKHGISGVPVVDEDGAFQGIFSDAGTPDHAASHVHVSPFSRQLRQCITGSTRVNVYVNRCQCITGSTPRVLVSFIVLQPRTSALTLAAPHPSRAWAWVPLGPGLYRALVSCRSLGPGPPAATGCHWPGCGGGSTSRHRLPQARLWRRVHQPPQTTRAPGAKPMRISFMSRLMQGAKQRAAKRVGPGDEQPRPLQGRL